MGRKPAASRKSDSNPASTAKEIDINQLNTSEIAIAGEDYRQGFSEEIVIGGLTNHEGYSQYLAIAEPLVLYSIESGRDFTDNREVTPLEALKVPSTSEKGSIEGESVESTSAVSKLKEEETPKEESQSSIQEKIFPERRIEFRRLRESIDEKQSRLIELDKQANIKRGFIGKLWHRRSEKALALEIGTLKDELSSLKKQEKEFSDKLRNEYKGPREFTEEKIKDSLLARISIPEVKQGKLPTNELLYQKIQEIDLEKLNANRATIKMIEGADTLLLSRKLENGETESVRISYRNEGKVAISYKSSNDADWSPAKSAWNDDAYKIAEYFLTTSGSWDRVKVSKKQNNKYLVEPVKFDDNWKPVESTKLNEASQAKEQETPQQEKKETEEKIEPDVESAAEDLESETAQSHPEKKVRRVAKWSERRSSEERGRAVLRPVAAFIERNAYRIVGGMINLPGDIVRLASSAKMLPNLIDRWSSSMVRAVKDGFHAWRANAIHTSGDKLQVAFKSKIENLAKLDKSEAEKMRDNFASILKKVERLYEQANEDGVVTAGERKAIELSYQKAMVALNRRVDDAIRYKKWEIKFNDIF